MAEQARMIATWGPEREREDTSHQHQGHPASQLLRALSSSIITVPNEFLSKLDLVDKDLPEFRAKRTSLPHGRSRHGLSVNTARDAAE
jgi:hypothetical protein